MSREPQGGAWPALVLLIVVLGLCASYGLAVLGEPSSAWLWGLP